MESTDDDQAQEELKDLEQLIDSLKVQIHRVNNLNLSKDHQVTYSSLMTDLWYLSLK